MKKVQQNAHPARSKKEVQAIRKKLKYGDSKIIAGVAGCSVEMARKVLQGRRGCRSGKGKEVIEAAMKLLATRSSARDSGWHRIS